MMQPLNRRLGGLIYSGPGGKRQTTRCLRQDSNADRPTVKRVLLTTDLFFFIWLLLGLCRIIGIGKGQERFVPKVFRACRLPGDCNNIIFHVLIFLSCIYVVQFKSIKSHWRLSEPSQVRHSFNYYHYVNCRFLPLCHSQSQCRSSSPSELSPFDPLFITVPVVTTMSGVIAVSTVFGVSLYSHTYQLLKLETHTTYNISRQSRSFGVFQWYLQKKSSSSRVTNTCVHARLSETC